MKTNQITRNFKIQNGIKTFVFIKVGFEKTL